MLIARQLSWVALILFNACPLTYADDILGLRVDAFSSHDKRTIEVFRDLARHVRIPIGVSGESFGHNPDTRISVDSDGRSLREVLDDIYAKDPTFTWKLFDDGSINVTLGKRPLSLIDVYIGEFTLQNVKPRELSNAVLGIPELGKWARKSGCSMAHRIVIIGSPPEDTDPGISFEVRAEPLWKALNNLLVSTNSHFWSAVQYIQKPSNVTFNAP